MMCRRMAAYRKGRLKMKFIYEIHNISKIDEILTDDIMNYMEAKHNASFCGAGNRNSLLFYDFQQDVTFRVTIRKSIKLRMVGNSINDKRFENAVEDIAHYSEIEDTDKYYERLEYYSILFNLSENFIEDAVTDFIYLGSHEIG